MIFVYLAIAYNSPECIVSWDPFQALKLSHSALGQTAPGKVVNLLSNDVNRFELVSLLINALWTAPTLTIIIGILLWLEIGWAGVVGIAIVFVVVPIQSEWQPVNERAGQLLPG